MDHSLKSKWAGLAVLFHMCILINVTMNSSRSSMYVRMCVCVYTCVYNRCTSSCNPHRILMGGPTLRCSPIDGDKVLPAVFDEDTNIGNVTCLPVMGNTIGTYARIYVCMYVCMCVYVRM